MKTINYFIAAENHLKKNLTEFKSLVKSLDKKPIGKIQIEELCAMADYPNGVYLFFNDENDLMYVGKTTSRSFIERIPAHFDQRESAWFNTLPKKIMSAYKTDSFQKALEIALSLKFVMVGVKGKSEGTNLESALRFHLQPKLNSARKNRFQSDCKLSDVLLN